MAKNNVEYNNKDEYYDGTEEDNILTNIYKENFVKILEEKGFDETAIKNLMIEKRISTADQSKFNYTLRRIKKEYHINITDMILFLENENYRIRKILLILDEETISILRKELSKKYKIKIEENELYKLFK